MFYKFRLWISFQLTGANLPNVWKDTNYNQYLVKSQPSKVCQNADAGHGHNGQQQTKNYHWQQPCLQFLQFQQKKYEVV